MKPLTLLAIATAILMGCDSKSTPKAAWQGEHQLTSPSNTLTMQFGVTPESGTPTYSLHFGDKAVILPSAMGFELRGDTQKKEFWNGGDITSNASEVLSLNSGFTIKEVKNGEGPHPIKTDRGWLHLAHGVRGCASGLRYVLYLYMTALDDPSRVIAEPAGFFMAPEGGEYIGDVMNVLFTNGWIADEDGTIFIYYASSDTRMHVATSTVDRLVDYCFNTEPDAFTTGESVARLNRLIDRNII